MEDIASTSVQLSKLFRYSIRCSLRGESVSEQIYSALLGPASWRPRRWQPTEENRNATLRTIERYVALDLPLDCISLAGATKHYGLTTQMHVDAADASWIGRLVAIDENVRAVYAPGIEHTIVLEDFAERFLSVRTEDLDMRLDAYRESLRELASRMAGSWLRLVTESSLFALASASTDIESDFAVRRGLNIRYGEYREIASRCHRVLHEYLRATEHDGIVPDGSGATTEAHDRHPTTLALHHIGFRGGVSTPERRHHARCAVRACGQVLTPAAQMDQTARYLATVLTRNRMGVPCPLYEDSEGPIPRVKLSFMPVAPGSPRTLERNRIEYVAYNRSKRSGNHVAPWAGIGYLDEEGNEPRITIRSLYEISNDAYPTPLAVTDDDSDFTVPVWIE